MDTALYFKTTSRTEISIVPGRGFTIHLKRAFDTVQYGSERPVRNSFVLISR